MDYYEAVAAQPNRLSASAGSVTEALSDTDLEPWRTGQLGVVSMGASSHAANALVHRLGRHGRRAVNLDASDVMTMGASVDLADSYVFVSEGGHSRETIEAARAVGAAPKLALTNVPTAPIAEVVDVVVGLDHGDDSKVYTVGYIATLQAFGLLATALDGQDEGVDWSAVPALVGSTLADLAGLAPGPGGDAGPGQLDRLRRLRRLARVGRRGGAALPGVDPDLDRGVRHLSVPARPDGVSDARARGRALRRRA